MAFIPKSWIGILNFGPNTTTRSVCVRLYGFVFLNTLTTTRNFGIEVYDLYPELGSLLNDDFYVILGISFVYSKTDIFMKVLQFYVLM